MTVCKAFSLFEKTIEQANRCRGLAGSVASRTSAWPRSLFFSLTCTFRPTVIACLWSEDAFDALTGNTSCPLCAGADDDRKQAAAQSMGRLPPIVFMVL